MLRLVVLVALVIEVVFIDFDRFLFKMHETQGSEAPEYGSGISCFS